MKEMDMIKDIIRAYRNYPDRVAFVIDDTSYTYQEVFARRTPLFWPFCYPRKLT